MAIAGAVTKTDMFFIKSLRKYQDATVAAKIVWGGTDAEARKEGKAALKRLKVPLSEALEYVGLDTRRDIKDLARLREAKKKHFFAHEGQVIDEREVDDHAVQMKALQLCLQIKGTAAPKQAGEGDLAYKVLQIINKTTNININTTEPAKDVVDITSEESATSDTQKPILSKETPLTDQLEQIKGEGVPVLEVL